MIVLPFCAALLLAGLQASADTKPSNSTAIQAPSATHVGSADVATPVDPQARVDLARRMNGLRGYNIQPWHLKADYELLGIDGKSKSTGTFEEWWASEKNYRISYRSAGFSQDIYGTDRGIFRAGDSEAPLRPLGLLGPLLTDPVDTYSDLRDHSPWNVERQFKSLKVSCTVSGKLNSYQQHEDLPGVCLAPTNGVLLCVSVTPHSNRSCS